MDELYAKLGIDPYNMGVVMLDVEDPLLGKDIPKGFLDGDGIVHDSHVTLLYGLMTNANDQIPNIKKVLEGWTKPAILTISGFGTFPPGQDGAAPVVAFVKDPSLTDAYHRLSRLPHINTHPIYNPHITVAYVQGDLGQSVVDLYLTPLLKNGLTDLSGNKYLPVYTLDLNYGRID